MWRQPPRLSRQSEARRSNSADRMVYNLRMPPQPVNPITTSDWQIQQIQSAIAEADAGDFATDAEVKAVMDKWNV